MDGSERLGAATLLHHSFTHLNNAVTNLICDLYKNLPMLLPPTLPHGVKHQYKAS